MEVGRERRLAAIRAKLRSQGQQSLLAEAPALATEYYTSEEMAAFKKPKKKPSKKLRKRGLKPDDLLSLGSSGAAAAADKDYGSRYRVRPM